MLDDIPLYALFVTLAVLLFLSAFFSGSETALMSVNRYQLAHSAASGNKAAQRVLKLLGYPDRLISLILLGNNFINILAAQLATYIGYHLYGNSGIAIATGILTFVILIFAELTPKVLAIRYAQKVSAFTSWIYLPLMTLAYPLIALISLVCRCITQGFGCVRPSTHDQPRSAATSCARYCRVQNKAFPPNIRKCCWVFSTSSTVLSKTS